MYACLGDCDGLLFHHLVDGHPILLPHLIELIDTHHPTVREHHGSRLEPAFPRLGTGGDRSGEADAATSPSGGRNGERRHLERRPQNLRLGRTGIPHHENVNVPTEVRAIVEVPSAAPQQLQHERPFDLSVSVDGGRGAPSKKVQHVRPGADLFDFAQVVDRELSGARGGVLPEHPEVVAEHHRLEDPAGRGPVGGGERAVHPHHAYPVPRLAPVHQVRSHEHIHAPGQLPHGGPLRHLLHRDALMVRVLAESVLRLQRIPVRVLRRIRPAGGLHVLVRHLHAGGVQRGQSELRIGRIHVVARIALSRGRTVVDAAAQLRQHRGALGHHALQRHEAAQRGAAQAAGGDVQASAQGAVHGAPDFGPAPFRVVAGVQFGRQLVGGRLQGADVGEGGADEATRQGGIGAAQVTHVQHETGGTLTGGTAGTGGAGVRGVEAHRRVYSFVVSEPVRT
mmetsp:Transcript_1043/g.2254  ORF Transcript_1043/g.2254 Transcript_1043/m.2254 type:complete len:452 (+) Transcript_1043:1112-2467(+)